MAPCLAVNGRLLLALPFSLQSYRDSEPTRPLFLSCGRASLRSPGKTRTPAVSVAIDPKRLHFSKVFGKFFSLICKCIQFLKSWSKFWGTRAAYTVNFAIWRLFRKPKQLSRYLVAGGHFSVVDGLTTGRTPLSLRLVARPVNEHWFLTKFSGKFKIQFNF